MLGLRRAGSGPTAPNAPPGRESIASITLTEVPAGGGDPFGPESAACEALLGRTSRPTIFLAPWWISAWHRACGSGDAPTVVRALDGDDLVGVAALSADGETLSLAGDPDLFDYQDLAIATGREAEVCAALMDHLGAGGGPSPGWREFVLPSTRAGSASATALAEAARDRGMGVECDEAGAAPAVELPGTWDEFLGSLPKRHRHELRRKMRRLHASGSARQVTVSGPDGLEDHVDEFLGLMAATNEMKAGFLTAPRRRFFHLVAAEAAARGALRLSFLELEGRRVAGCLIFDCAGEYMLYNSGYDPARSDLSVGLLNKALAIREAIEAGRGAFDFLKGAERYKYGLGGRDRAIHRIVVTRTR